MAIIGEKILFTDSTGGENQKRYCNI
jgi:hypothetical protein